MDRKELLKLRDEIFIWAKIELNGLIVFNIDAQMERTPYPICWNSTEIYKDLIGISAFEKGVLKKIVLFSG